MNYFALILADILLVIFICIFFKHRKYLALYVIAVVLFLPKINIISLSPEAPAGLRTEDLIIAFFLAFTVIGEKFKSCKAVFSTKLYKIFLLFLLGSVISFITGIVSGYTYSVSLSFFNLLRKVEYFCFVFVGYDLYYYNKGNVRSLIKKMLNVFVVFTAVISLFQVFHLIGSWRFGQYDANSFSGYAVGTFNGHYESGAFFIITAVIYFYDIIKNIENKWQNGIYLLISLLLILFSKSRTSLIIVAIILVLMTMNYCETKTKVLTIVGGGLGLAVFMVLVKFTDIMVLERFKPLNIGEAWHSFTYYFDNRSYSEYLYTLRNDISVERYVIQTGDISFNARMFKWMAMLDVLIKFPLFGYGFGSNSTIDGSYVKLLAENGVIGLTLFILIFVEVMKQLSSNKKHGFLIWVIISVFLGSILIDLFEASKIMEFLWFIIGAFSMMSADSSKNKIPVMNEYTKVEQE